MGYNQGMEMRETREHEACCGVRTLRRTCVGGGQGDASVLFKPSQGGRLTVAWIPGQRVFLSFQARR